jgi:hypothetical protein
MSEPLPILKSDNETDVLGEEIAWEEKLIGGNAVRSEQSQTRRDKDYAILSIPDLRLM